MHPQHSKIVPKSVIHRLGRVVFSAFVYSVFRTYARVVVKGTEYLPKEPFIICSNHQSHLDGIILAHISSYRFSKSLLIAAKDYWYDHKGRFHLSSLFFNIIPVSRKTDGDEPSNFNQVAKKCTEFINDGGKSIIILPEGTRSVNNQVKPFKKGISLLAQHTKLKVVPVYIRNSGELWPKGSYYLKPGKIHISIGRSIDPEELTLEDGAEVIRQSIISMKEDN